MISAACKKFLCLAITCGIGTAAFAILPTPGYYWPLDYHYTNSITPGTATLSPQDACVLLPGRIGTGSVELKRSGTRLIGSGVNLTAASYTISFWINPGALPYGTTNANGIIDSIICAKSSTSVSVTNQFEIMFGANSNVIRGKIQARVFDVGYGSSASALTTQPLLMNRWTHFALTVDNTAKLATIYLNGIKDASVPLGAIVPASSGDRIGFGNRFNGTHFNDNGTTTTYFCGYLDEIKIWPSTALTAAQVLELASEKPRPDYWWTFDETSKDFTGYQDATVDGMTNLASSEQFVPGNIGSGAISLNGASNFAEAPAVSFGKAGNYSMALWLNPTNYAGAAEYYLLDEEVATNQLQVSLVGSGGSRNVRVKIFGTNAASATVNSSATIPLNQWTHVAFTVGVSNIVQLFVNGTADASAAMPFVPVSVTNAFRMGAKQNGTAFFAGYLDDVRIYRDKILALSEITNIFSWPELLTQSPNDTQYGRYFQSERRMYEYMPDFIPGKVTFDSMNRPYIRKGSYIETLNSSNQWVRLDFRPFIKAQYPTWDYVPLTNFLVLDGEFGNTKIIFDDNDWAYMHLNTQNRTTTSPLKNFDLILYSTDYCRTWKMISVTNTYSIAWEQRGWNGSLSRPPMLLACDTFLVPCKMRAYEFVKNGSTLALTNITLFETNALGIYSHSGLPRQIITLSNQTHIIWSRNTNALGTTNVSVFVKTLNRLTGAWSPDNYLGNIGHSVDGHDQGGLELDSQGYLHAMLVGHHDPALIYYKSALPNSVASWSAASLVGTNSTSNGHSYATLVCDAFDNLHVTTRYSGFSYVFNVGYWNKPVGQPWTTNAIMLARSTDDNYVNWGNHLMIDRLGNIFASYVYDYQVLDLACYDDYVREWPEDGMQAFAAPVLPPPQRYDYIAASTHGHDPILRILPSGGSTWRLATTPDFAGNLIRPTLGYNASNGTNTLAWNVVAYKLQSTTNLAVSWVDYPGGSNSPVAVPMSKAQEFFRLAPK
jgi:hypothetical protein